LHKLSRVDFTEVNRGYLGRQLIKADPPSDVDIERRPTSNYIKF
jgi:hypothetical protein